MKKRFQKIIICTFGLIFFSISSAFSQTIFNSNSDDDISIKVSQVEYEGMTLEFFDSKSNTSDTVIYIPGYVVPKEIRDIQFDSEACGFILETEGYLQYRLYVKSESGWKIKGEEVFLLKGEPRKVGFGGFRLFDIYTIRFQDVYYEDEKYRTEYRIHIYDSNGNRSVLKQVAFNESKY